MKAQLLTTTALTSPANAGSLPHLTGLVAEGALSEAAEAIAETSAQWGAAIENAVLDAFRRRLAEAIARFILAPIVKDILAGRLTAEGDRHV